jgi:hypothetical protein
MNLLLSSIRLQYQIQVFQSIIPRLICIGTTGSLNLIKNANLDFRSNRA